LLSSEENVMRFIQLLPFLGAFALRHTGTPEPLLILTSADPDGPNDIGGSIYDSSNLTGCTVAGTRLRYTCGPEKPVPEALESGPQLVSFRVDCRKANFHLLTMRDIFANCARMTYKKYTGSDDFRSYRDYMGYDALTFEKGTVFVAHCVLGRLPDTSTRRWQGSEASATKNREVQFQLLTNNMTNDPRNHRLVPESAIFTVTNVTLETSGSNTESCQSQLEEVYDWTLELENSTNNKHLLRFASPKAQMAQWFKNFKFPKNTAEGELFALQPRDLITRISLSSDESIDRSQTQLIFHGTEQGEDHYALYFDVTVNVSNFTDNTTYVTADVFIQAPRPLIKISKQIQLPVIMQVKPTAFRIVGKWWFWLLLVGVLLSLTANGAYIYRLQRPQRPS